MTYGTIKVDTVTFTNAGVDKSVTLSGLVQNPVFSGNVTVTGTLSGVTVTGTTANFTSGNFTNISGGTHTITSGVFAAGSAASPSITFTGDLNTGIYSPGADQVAISTGGSGRLFVDANGNIAVGTSATSNFGATARSFDINSAGGIANLYVKTGTVNGGLQADAGNGYMQVWTASNHPIAFNIAFSEKMRLDTSGRLGVGTSSPSWPLDVNGVVRSTGTSAMFALSDRSTGTGDRYGIYSNSNTFRIYDFTAAADRVVVDSSGRVGVGTTTPQGLFSLTSAGTSTQLTVQTVAGANDIIKFDTYNASAVKGVYAWYQQNSEVMRLDASGRLGIGTSSPGQLLDVQGNSNPQIKVSETNNSTSAGLFIENQGQRNWQLWADRSTDTFRLGNNSRATTNVAVDSTGRVGIGTTSPAVNLEVRKDENSQTTIKITNANTGSAAASILQLQSGTASDVVNFAASKSGAYLAVQGYNSINTIYSDFTAHIWRNQAGTTEYGRFDSSGRLLIGTSTSLPVQYSGESKVQIAGNGIYNLSALQYSNNAFESIISLGKSRSASVGSHTIVQNNDCLGSIRFEGSDGTGFITGTQISAFVDGTPGTNDMPVRLTFSTTADGASSPTERMRIANDGSVFIGTTTAGLSNTTGFGFNNVSANGSYINIGHPSGVGSGVEYIGFSFNGSQIGSIRQSGTTAVTYNTTSDYRLKENLTPIANAIGRLTSIPTYRFNFISEPERTVDGFIAHEVQAIVPEAVTGEKDAVDDEGNPIYQGIDQSKLVPLLTAALQEAIGRIEILEAEVAALKAQ